MSSGAEKQNQPFILEQLEEALEERQGSDRRKAQQPLDPGMVDRRKGDRRQIDTTNTSK